MITEPLCHCPAFFNNMLINVNADHAAPPPQHIVQVIIHHKAEIRFSTGAVQKDDFLPVVFFEHGGNQFNIVVYLVIFTDHIVFELSVCCEDAYFP